MPAHTLLLMIIGASSSVYKDFLYSKIDTVFVSIKQINSPYI